MNQHTLQLMQRVSRQALADKAQDGAGHLLLPALLSGLCADDAPKLLAACTDLYASHLNSCGDSLTLTYEHNNYTKACLSPTSLQNNQFG